MSENHQIKFRSAIFDIQLTSPNPEFLRKEMRYLIEETYRLAKNPGELSSSMILEAPSSAAVEAAPEPIELPAEEPAPPAEQPAPVAAVSEPAQPKKRGPAKGAAKGKAKTKAKAKEEKAAPAPKAKGVKGKAKPEAKKAAPEIKTAEGVDAKTVADYIMASEKFPVFQTNILNKANQLNRILLSFYFAENMYGKKGLTTGDVEAITEALNAGIKSTNISSQLKKYEDLFNARGERKRGSVVYYSLNKKGRQQFEELLATL